MTKVAIKNENITSFGGIYHIMDVFSKLGFEKLTESVLGKRGSSGKAFSYGSIFGSLFFSYLCGGECLEDINVLIGQFKQRPNTLLPGADTVGRGLKELAEENIVYNSETSGKSYSFNTAEKLNTLLLRMIRRMGLIKVGSHVDLDFDHQFVPAHKFDAKYSYKQDFGYFPGWASIGGIIVGGENRDGNTNVRFHQEDTLRRIMDRVTSELGVVIERFRADCGSFSKEIITFYNERGASEKNFDIQNNDFGWSHLPFSFMAENMVFMMVTAMLKNFYLVRHISEKDKPLKKTSRLKAFILHFVSVPAKWVRTGRQNVLNLYTNKTYYAEVFLE
ncbi:transposase [Prevotella jejuni]|uniref:transposase n=1 Tax=Prevotella jejuni TaxID=1177574 RepID=UPI001BA456F1|nr:transposase [Prevotella jejuni]QUB81966.1 transposase [Prevotella jejuni]